MEDSTILVVDDSMSNLLLLKDILSGFNYNVITEIDGEKVQSLLQSNKIDLILLDIMMPKIDGFEVCRRLKNDQTTKEIPVIFLTAKVDEQSLLKGFEIGGVDFIKKPFLVSELMARVRTHIKLKKSTEQLKNELYQHFLTRQSLQISQTELSMRNAVASVFLSKPGDELFAALAEEVLKYINCDAGIIGYNDENGNLVCPALKNPNDKSRFEFPIDFTIGICARAISEKNTAIITGEKEKIFYSHDEFAYVVATPVVYHEMVIGIISAASKEGKPDSNLKSKLEAFTEYVSPIFYSRLTARRYDNARRKAERLLQESEERYRTLFNQNNDAVIVYDTDEKGRLFFSEINDTAVFASGYSRDDFFNAKPGDFIEPIFSKSVLDRLYSVFENGSITFETYLKHKSGKSIPVEIHAGKFARKNKFSIMIVVRDISERKDLNKQILNTIVETEERERNRFAKDVHDGLGAILSSINMYINLLERGALSADELPSAYSEMKSLIGEAVASSKEIANNLMPDTLANFGLTASIKALCKRLVPEGKPEIIFETENFSEPENSKIKTSIFRIVSELIANAVKHSQATRAAIILKGENNYVRLGYSDNGKGFDYQIIEKQIKQKQYSGLTNIIGRVSGMNGDIKIKTAPDKGLNIDIIINTDSNI